MGSRIALLIYQEHSVMSYFYGCGCVGLKKEFLGYAIYPHSQKQHSHFTQLPRVLSTFSKMVLLYIIIFADGPYCLGQRTSV